MTSWFVILIELIMFVENQYNLITIVTIGKIGENENIEMRHISEKNVELND